MPFRRALCRPVNPKTDPQATAPPAAAGQAQADAYDTWHDPGDLARYAYHSDPDPLTAFLRDRRIGLAVDLALRMAGAAPADWTALVTCGGVGGEGTYLAGRGFREVTVSDVSEAALSVCRRRDPRLLTIRADGEATGLPDGCHDLVLVRDGLHHLPRPGAGLAEMLRLARRAVVVMEPATGAVPALLGTAWERHGGSWNYVYRWDTALFAQTVFSALLRTDYAVAGVRLWDHAPVVGRLVRRLPGGARLAAARGLYGTLDTLARPFGNNFVGVVVKNPVWLPPGARLPSKGRETSF